MYERSNEWQGRCKRRYPVFRIHPSPVLYLHPPTRWTHTGERTWRTRAFLSTYAGVYGTAPLWRRNVHLPTDGSSQRREAALVTHACCATGWIIRTSARAGWDHFVYFKIRYVTDGTNNIFKKMWNCFLSFARLMVAKSQMGECEGVVMRRMRLRVVCINKMFRNFLKT